MAEGRRHPANYVSAALRIVIAAVGLLVAIGAVVGGGWLALLTFTVQSNLMVAIAFIWTAWALLTDRRTPPEWLAGSAIYYIAITGLVYNFMLNPYSFRVGDPVLWGLTSSDIAHVVMPVLAFLVWLVLAEHRRIPWRYIWIWLIYLVVYLTVILVVIQFAGEVSAPYPFLDVDTVGWSGLAATLIRLLVAFVVLATVMVALDRCLPARTRLSEFDRFDPHYLTKGRNAGSYPGITP